MSNVLQITADAEQEDNVLEQKRNQGKKVLYGHVVQVINVFHHSKNTNNKNFSENNNKTFCMDTFYR